MDVRWFELSPRDRRVSAQVADAGGERRELLDGERADRVLAAATPLVDALAAGAEGAVHTLSVDVSARAVHAPSATAHGARHELGALAPLVQAVARAIANEVTPRMPVPAGAVLDAAFWSRLYREGQDGWELGRPAPPLVRWVEAHRAELAGVPALVVGAGRGHEARLLAGAGARVVAIDYAPEALSAARALAASDGVGVDFRDRDVFALALEPERYQLVLEHTCFCAIAPARRAEYVQVIADVLVPGGTFVALFWLHGRPGGPPFSATRDEVEGLLAPCFETLAVEVPADSVATRLGQELLLTLRRR